MDRQVTCVIPCHNHASTLERAVKSAFDAGCNRVMVANDGSIDSSKEVIQKIYHEYYAPDFRITTFDSWGIRNGAGATRNHMINCPLAHDLIVCLDADDTLNNITPLVNAWQPGTWVYGNHNEILDDTITPRKGAPIGTLANKMVTGITFLFAKEDWQRVWGFDIDFAYAEDYGFQCALTDAGIKGVYIDTTVYNRHMRPEGNYRTILAGQYWSFYHQMARRKYPSVFAGTG